MQSGMAGACRVLALAAVAASIGCGGGLLKPQREYEEELYLSLDGSATMNLNASVAALVALRGVDLPVDPRARLDRQRVRELFAHPGGDVAVSVSRRDGRRFVHVRIDVGDVRRLAEIAPLSWSTYRFSRRDDVFEYVQTIGAPAGKDVGDVAWDGSEVVGFKLHLPSEILFENADGDVERGNILEWEQTLSSRLAGEPLRLEAHMATESILYTTLVLFGSTIVAAAATFGLVLWWVARRGREAGMAESHP
jgi:hypothetical protein